MDNDKHANLPPSTKPKQPSADVGCAAYSLTLTYFLLGFTPSLFLCAASRNVLKTLDGHTEAWLIFVGVVSLASATAMCRRVKTEILKPVIIIFIAGGMWFINIGAFILTGCGFLTYPANLHPQSIASKPTAIIYHCSSACGANTIGSV